MLHNFCFCFNRPKPFWTDVAGKILTDIPGRRIIKQYLDRLCHINLNVKNLIFSIQYLLRKQKHGLSFFYITNKCNFYL